METSATKGQVFRSVKFVKTKRIWNFSPLVPSSLAHSGKRFHEYHRANDHRAQQNQTGKDERPRIVTPRTGTPISLQEDFPIVPVRRRQNRRVNRGQTHDMRISSRRKGLSRDRLFHRGRREEDEREAGGGDADGARPGALVACEGFEDLGALESTVCLELAAECLPRSDQIIKVM